MSLTQDDLLAIRTLVKEEVEQVLEQKLEEKLAPIKTELQEHGKTLHYLKKKVNRIDKTVDIIGRTYDTSISENSRDIRRIKEHLKLPLTN